VITGEAMHFRSAAVNFMHVLRRNLDIRLFLDLAACQRPNSLTSVFGQRTKSTPPGVIDYR
jgi:hypothetical protein